MSCSGPIDETLFQKISLIVNNSQNGPSNHMKNIKLLENLYNSSDFEQFLYIFFIICSNVVESRFQNPYTKYILEFLAKFVAHIATAQQVDENDAEDEPPTHPFLKRVFEYIIKFHDDPSEDCKYNTCSFLTISLENLGGNAVLDNNIFSLISEALLENLQDPNFLIRAQVLIALTRFQNPTNPECQVVPAYVKCLNDSNYLVRQRAVQRIAPTRKNLTKIARKIRDPNPAVRIAAFTHLANIGIKYLKIEDRQFVLKGGFAEENKHVKKSFLEYLLPKWLTNVNGSYLDLLKLIKLDSGEEDLTSTEELSNQIMETLFTTESIDKLIETLPLEESKVIPDNQIESELAHYWNIMVKYLSQSEALEEYLDKITPELTLFCNYIERLVDNKFSKAKDEWEYLHFQYMLYYLFDMAENFDFSDEVGRNTLDKLIRKVLRKYRCKPRLLNKMIEIGRKLASNVDSFINDVCLIISDIWQPLIDEPPNQEDKFAKDFKIAALSVKLNVLEEDCEKAVINNDFEKAHQLKTEREQCQKEMEKLTAEDVSAKQSRVTTEDPDTICWCLDLLTVILESNSIKKMSPSLETWRKEFLMPLITSKNAEIEWRAFKCLSIYCILDEKLMVEQLQTLYLPIVSYKIIPNFNKEILIQSIAIMADLIRLQGTNLFKLDNESVQNVTKRRLYTEAVDEVNDINNSLTVDVIINAFLDLLDDEDSDISDNAATALAKLILNGFSTNSMMMTRLLLQWFNPAKGMLEGAGNGKKKRSNSIHEETLQQRLGLVIKAYTDKIPESKKIIAHSVVPILTNIADAPQTSPLTNIDMNEVIKFLIAITDSEVHGLMHIHTDLARIVLREISSRPAQITTVYFAKLLYQLNITPDNCPAVKELITNTQLILEKEMLDKTSISQLTKFVKKLSGLPANSNANTTTLSTNESNANTTVSNAIQNRKRTITEARRLSAVIDEDEEETNSNKDLSEAHEVSKSRKIDLENDSDMDDQPNTVPELSANNEDNDTRQSNESQNIATVVSSSQSGIIGSSQSPMQHNLRNTEKSTKRKKLKVVIERALLERVAVNERNSANQNTNDQNRRLNSSEGIVSTQLKKRFKRNRRRASINEVEQNPKIAAKYKKRKVISFIDPTSTTSESCESAPENITGTSTEGSSSESNSTGSFRQGVKTTNYAEDQKLKTTKTTAVIQRKSTNSNNIAQNGQPSFTGSTNSFHSNLQRRSTRQNNVKEIVAENSKVARKTRKNGDISNMIERNSTITRNSPSTSQSSGSTETTNSRKNIAHNSEQERVLKSSTSRSESSTGSSPNGSKSRTIVKGNKKSEKCKTRSVTRSSTSRSESSTGSSPNGAKSRTNREEAKKSEKSKTRSVTRSSTSRSESSTGSSLNGAKSRTNGEEAKKSEKSKIPSAKKIVPENNRNQRNKRRLLSSVTDSNNEAEEGSERSRRFSKRRRLDVKMNGKLLEVGTSSETSSGNTPDRRSERFTSSSNESPLQSTRKSNRRTNRK